MIILAVLHLKNMCDVDTRFFSSSLQKKVTNLSHFPLKNMKEEKTICVSTMEHV